MTPLLERVDAGVKVLVVWDAVTEDVLLVISTFEHEVIAPVARNERGEITGAAVRDAFDHPASYLTREDQRTIFGKR